MALHHYLTWSKLTIKLFNLNLIIMLMNTWYIIIINHLIIIIQPNNVQEHNNCLVKILNYLWIHVLHINYNNIYIITHIHIIKPYILSLQFKAFSINIIKNNNRYRLCYLIIINVTTHLIHDLYHSIISKLNHLINIIIIMYSILYSLLSMVIILIINNNLYLILYLKYMPVINYLKNNNSYHLTMYHPPQYFIIIIWFIMQSIKSKSHYLPSHISIMVFMDYLHQISCIIMLHICNFRSNLSLIVIKPQLVLCRLLPLNEHA